MLLGKIPIPSRSGTKSKLADWKMAQPARRGANSQSESACLAGRQMPAGSSEAGVTLLEMVCVLAIIGLLAMIALPRLALSTSQPRLEAYALQVAALLKADRNAALARGRSVVSSVDARGRIVRSGSGVDFVRIPDDVVFDALLPQRCNGRPALSTISFFGDGISCGGAIRLTHSGSGFEVRVNWLTGDIDIVAQNAR
jgi:general secretion pathway protein H